MATVGVIVNPHAGKDVRRLVSGASPVTDATKVAIVRRVIVGAAESGAARIVLGADHAGLAERAAHGLDVPVELLDGPQTGAHLDTIAAARNAWKVDADALVVLGGDGTCRDVVTGWPDAPLIALSTGTNNVFPTAGDGTSAGVAAGLIASGRVALELVAHVAQRINVRVDAPNIDTAVDESALVDVALIDAAFAGARAVTDPQSIRWVIAAIADPASTGLAAIAGRIAPSGRREPGGVLIRLGDGGRRVRVPLAPGTFTTLGVTAVTPLPASTPVALEGGGMIAYDGERTTPAPVDTTITASIEASGPRLIDVERTLAIAAAERLFDLEEGPHGH
ncbi:MAG: NAD(+)/NADH kinase [Actinomycetota bacterium]